MSQDERFDTSVVFCCGQWDLGCGTAQRRLIVNSATSLPAGLQKKVSINTPVLLIFFWQAYLSWCDKTKLLLAIIFVRDITGFTKLYWQWTDFFIAYLARILTVFGRKETNALGDADDNGCTFATGYILYTGCFQAWWYKNNSRRRRLQTSCIVSCFISSCLRISAVKSNFIFKKSLSD